MTKQHGSEPLRACPKARYEDGLDTAKMLGFSVFWPRKNSKPFLIYCFNIGLVLNFNGLFHL